MWGIPEIAWDPTLFRAIIYRRRCHSILLGVGERQLDKDESAPGQVPPLIGAGRADKTVGEMGSSLTREKRKISVFLARSFIPFLLLLNYRIFS
jgi:hypothetical protein